MAYTVLRTAAGSPVAPSVIQALKEMSDVRVVAVDIDPYACGFLSADAAHLVPRVDDPAFLEAMLAVCRAEKVDLLFPDLDEELPLLAQHKARFEAIGTQVMVSPPDTIATCFDKYRTYQFFRENGIPAPISFLPDEISDPDVLPWPLFIKPRSGRGSRHAYKLTNTDELEFFTRMIERPIVQEFIDGVEYTIDTLSDQEGRFLYCSVRERMATDSGISTKGRTVSHPVIEAHVKKIVEGLGLVGPACVQGIEDGEGNVGFIEVNPRIAGSAVLSFAAGAPVAADAVRLFRGQVPVGKKNYRTGRIMLRAWQEHFVDAPLVDGND